GRWVHDERRFPDGVAAVAEYAHKLGMKFGIWIEPERTTLVNVGERGVPERLLAMSDGGYGSETSAQICLGGAPGRQGIVDQLTALIDAVHPDYVKWDNNFWINCRRDDHGHGHHDGNFAHVSGLYQVLADLRTRYPALLIENVSGGGNRLD